MSRAVLITGATGKQGGSVIKALLKQDADFDIFALTRDPQSASALRLSGLSPKIKLIGGDLDQPEDIFSKVQQISPAPLSGVFSVQAPPIGFGTEEGIEEQQGKALIDAALKNKVQHFVYSSVDRGGQRSDTDPTDVPHFISKHEIEQHLFQKTKDSNGMTWTVLRPVAFFENLVPGFVGKIFSTSWEMTLRPDQKLQLIATSDINYFAAKALIGPEDFKNKKLSLAGDELTYKEFKERFQATTGQQLPTTYWFIAKLVNWMSKEIGYMFRWFRNVGYGADIPSLKKINPELKDFQTWLKEESQFRGLQK